MIIAGSHFVNNTANNYGGAIYCGTEVRLNMDNNTFKTETEILSTILSGIFIHSYSKWIFITDSLFEVLSSSIRNISVIYHSKESYGSSLTTGNLIVVCPVNTRLLLYNTTINTANAVNVGLLI